MTHILDIGMGWARRTAGIAALLLALAPGAWAQEKFPGATVESLLEVARSENPDYAATRHDAVAAKEGIYPAGAFPDPTLEREFEIASFTEGGTSHTDTGGGSGSVRYKLNQQVPFWGKRALRRDVAEAEALMVEGRSNATWNEIASKIKAAYAQYYVIARTEALTQEILAILLNLEKTAQARYLANLSTQQSAIEAQAEQTRTRTELVAIQTERRNLQYRINALLRRPPNAPLAEPQRLRTVPPPVKLDYAALEERLMIRNPQLFTDGAGVTAAAKGRELTYRNRWPDGSIGGVIFQTQDNRFVLPGLAWGIEIPLQQPRRRSEERQAEAKVAAAQERKNATENQLRSDLAQNLAALEGSIRTERLLETALVPQAEMSFQSAQAGYESTTGGMNEVGGIMTFDMLLDAQRQVRKAKLDLLKAQAETQVRLAEIERIVGEDL